jgi:hypothetical protein
MLDLHGPLMRIPLTAWRISLGRFIGPLASAVPKSAVIPIVQGPARGIRWLVGSGMQNFWLGTYEREKYELFYKALSLGMVVYDIGANTGIYNCACLPLCWSKWESIRLRASDDESLLPP